MVKRSEIKQVPVAEQILSRSCPDDIRNYLNIIQYFYLIIIHQKYKVFIRNPKV